MFLVVITNIFSDGSAYTGLNNFPTFDAAKSWFDNVNSEGGPIVGIPGSKSVMTLFNHELFPVETKVYNY